MDKSKLCFPFAVVLFLIFFNPVSAQTWYKGNTHTHTNRSDGKMAPADVVKAYRNEGYSFLFITDEDQVTPIEGFSDSAFICYTGEEAIFEEHISCLNIKTAVPPTNFIDVIGKTHTQGGFAVINHPKRYNHIVDAYKVVTSDIVKYIEIFNGKSEKDLYHDDQSTWDSVLTAGKLIYGVAADDFHEMKHISEGWIMVNAETLQRDSIIKSIEKGNFYSSSGTIFTKIEVTDTSIFVETTDALEIKFIGNNRSLLQTNMGKSAMYKISGEEGYIRVEARSEYSKKAWTQPLYWNKTFTGLPEKEPLYSTSQKSLLSPPYPNPTHDWINFRVAQNIARANFQIINCEGISAVSGRLDVNSGIDVSFLPDGIYILKVHAPEFSQCYRFVKF